MKLAVMQPYLFPYLGYFQLVGAVDRFVVFDDVNFINKGWINRNRVLNNGAEFMFTVPITKASQNSLIRDLDVAADAAWKAKFLKTLEHAYRKAPHFAPAFALVSSVVMNEEKNLAGYVTNSIQRVLEYAGVTTQVVPSSTVYGNADLRGKDRIIDICLREGADTYVNPPGGKDLYKPEDFERRGIALRLLQPRLLPYPQPVGQFMPGLSIIDVLMRCPADAVGQMMRDGELTVPDAASASQSA